MSTGKRRTKHFIYCLTGKDGFIMTSKKKYGRRIVAAAMAASLVIGTTTYHLAGEANARLHSVESSQYGDGVLRTNAKMCREHCNKCDIEIERIINMGDHYKNCVGQLDGGYGNNYIYADYFVLFKSTTLEGDNWYRELTKAQYDELSKLDVITVADVDALLGDPDTYDVQCNAVDATCTEAGSYTVVTYETVNGTEVGRETVTVPATGHTWDDGVATTAPTCTEAGAMTYTCTTCGETKTETVPATGHTAGEAVQENLAEPTCDAGGTYDSVVYCTVCGKEVSREFTDIPAIGHDWDEGYVDASPDCEYPGIVIYTCNNCHQKNIQTIPATGHTAGEAVKEKEIPATCTEGGSYESVVYCSYCDEELSRETIAVPATGHTAGEAVKEKEIPATCTEGGSYESVVYCTSCNEELNRETVTVPATGHTAGEAVKEKEIPATCTEGGSYEAVTYCTSCDEELSRETVSVPATGHAWDNGKITTAPTCTEAGVMTYTCSTCGETKTEAIDATGHTVGEAVKEKEIPATCTEAGSYESVVYCTVDGVELSREPITVPATGHAWDNGKITTAPTCTEAGVMTYTCTTCGETKTEAIDATGHTAGEAVKENVVDATVTEKGSYDLVTYCTVCGKELSRETVEIPATGTTIVDAEDVDPEPAPGPAASDKTQTKDPDASKDENKTDASTTEPTEGTTESGTSSAEKTDADADDTKKVDKTVQTADNNYLASAGILMLVSLAGILALLMKKKEE
jgi:hypothetical protein